MNNYINQYPEVFLIVSFCLFCLLVLVLSYVLDKQEQATQTEEPKKTNSFKSF